MTNKFNEFDIISRYFAPLVKNYSGALGLQDDAAILSHTGDNEIIVTVDTLISGIHFHEFEAPEVIAKRLLGCSISDLAAMGAEPLIFLLATAWPNNIKEKWISSFALSISDTATSYGISLAGGDTVATTGPMSLTATVLGSVPAGTALKRSGANEGDLLFVSGTIGDSALGLMIINGGLKKLTSEHKNFLVGRFKDPIPRTALGIALREVADAAIDISDGLLQDLEHLAQGSNVSIEVEADKIPISHATKQALSVTPNLMESVITGGDDYELAFTVPQHRVEEIKKIALTMKTRLTRVGHVVAGNGRIIVRDKNGSKIAFESRGYRHVFGSK